MSVATVVTPGNLGNEFDVGVIEANKIHLKVDGVTIQRLGTGELVSLAPPNAAIELVDKIGLTATLSGAATGNGTLSYIWSGTGATFATPTDPDTAVTFAAPGSYTIMLAVADGNGGFAVAERVVQVDRVLYVNGNQEDTPFGTLQGAFDWITANDSANVASYRIEVLSSPLDTVAIVPNTARVQLHPLVTVPVGLNITAAGTYHWLGHETSRGAAQPKVTTTTGHTVTLGANADFRAQGIEFTTTDAAGFAIYGNQATSASQRVGFKDCSFGGSGGSISLTGWEFVNFDNCITSRAVIIDGATNGQSWLRGCQFLSASGFTPVTLTNFVGHVADNYFLSAASAGVYAAGLELSAPTLAAGVLQVSGNQFHMVGGVVNIGACVKVVGGGAGVLRITENSLYAASATFGVGLHIVGTPPTNMLIANNTIEGLLYAILSTSDAAGATPLTYDGSDYIKSNTIKGAVANVLLGRTLVVNPDGGKIGENAWDQLTKLQTAFDWITANDSANAASYLIEVHGTTLDAARIVPNLATVHLNQGATLPVGVDFTAAGTYSWAGDSGPSTGAGDCRIAPTVGSAVTLSHASAVIRLNSLTLTTADTTVPILLATAGSVIVLTGCGFTGTGTYALLSSGVAVARVLDCTFPRKVSFIDCTNLVIRNCSMGSAPAGADTLDLVNCAGAVVSNLIGNPGTSLATAATPNFAVSVTAPVFATGRLVFANNTIDLLSGGNSTSRCGAIRVVSGGLGYLTISENTVFGGAMLGVIALHIVGVMTGNLRVVNNTLFGSHAGVLSTSDAAATVALPYANAPFYNNTIDGAVTNVTFAAGTLLPGGNIQS